MWPVIKISLIKPICVKASSLPKNAYPLAKGIKYINKIVNPRYIMIEKT